jgi:hypothetical protein|tara:strand:- start:590 stop:787 length:198 start_codon:yes stop_codon:yes gene_type:complete
MSDFQNIEPGRQPLEPISAYHKECPHCGAALFPFSQSESNYDDKDEKPDKICHCCGKKFIVLFGC